MEAFERGDPRAIHMIDQQRAKATDLTRSTRGFFLSTLDGGCVSVGSFDDGEEAASFAVTTACKAAQYALDIIAVSAAPGALTRGQVAAGLLDILSETLEEHA